MSKKTLKKEDGNQVENQNKLTAREYIENEYPALKSVDSIPDFLMAILTEVIKGRLEHE